MQTLFVGTYTADSESEGIYICDFCEETGQVIVQSMCVGVDNPSYLCVDSIHGRVFAVNEIFEYSGNAQGSISAFDFNSEKKKLTPINCQPSHGRAPCHTAVSSDGRYVFVANYMDGSICAYPVESDGSLGYASAIVRHHGTGLVQSRQEAAHAHSITLSPDGRFALVADLGIDQVVTYTCPAMGEVCRTGLPPGSGPRHLDFHPNGRWVYLINELNSTMTAYLYEDGRLDEINTLSTLPEGREVESITADVHVSPDGRFVYGTNRGHESITCFSVNQRTGAISFVECSSAGGEHPRSFAISPDGRFVLVANQNSNNIVTLAIESETGHLVQTDYTVTLPMPVCLKFLEER